MLKVEISSSRLFSPLLFLSVFHPTYNWRTSPLIIILVPEECKCSTKQPQPDPVKQQPKKMEKVVSIVKTQLMWVIHSNVSQQMPRASFSHLVCEILSPSQLLSYQLLLKEAILDPLPNYLL